jgi:hypothetical protein
MRGLDNPATFSLPFVDVCVKIYRHLHMLRTALHNSSVIFEGVLTNLDFWIACVGSQDAQDMISSIRNHKCFVKDCINAVFSCDAAAASSSVSRLFAQFKPQPLEFKKEIWHCASLALVLEQCLRDGDLVGAISCCCSIIPITSANGENVENLFSKVLSSLDLEDEDSTSHIPAVIGTLFEVASFISSRAAAPAAVSSQNARDVCEQAAEICNRIFAPLLREGHVWNEDEKQVENCSRKLLEAADSTPVSSMPAIAEKWAISNRSQIFNTIVTPLPQLKHYSWTCEAYTQASTGLNVLDLLCSSGNSEILSVLWVVTQLFSSASPSQIASSCPELYKVFLRCSCGSRKFDFAAAGTNAIPTPDILTSLASSCHRMCQLFSSDCSHLDRAKGISDFAASIDTTSASLTIAASFLHLRSVRKSLSGSFGSVSRFFQNVGHMNVVKLSLLLELKRFLDATYLLKHLQRSCLNREGSDDADIALIVDFCVAGLISQACKSLPSVSSPLGATLLFTACSGSTVNRSVTGTDFSKILREAIADPQVSEKEMELAVLFFSAVFQCFGKSFTVDIESHSASVVLFLERCQSLQCHPEFAQDFAPRFQQLAARIGPVLSANPKLLGESLTQFSLQHLDV